MTWGVVHGNKDVITALEDALVEAKSGTLEAVLIVGCSKNGRNGWVGAKNDDMEYAWARLQSAVDTAQMELLRDGMAHWI